ncbi:hypothetical protein BX600DRAFT_462191 [Xylariales sp. PMI_506]|nr:hypothetical protein BX600DRAFT_462191 [Xylariales sp. PMI_506]
MYIQRAHYPHAQAGLKQTVKYPSKLPVGSLTPATAIAHCRPLASPKRERCLSIPAPEHRGSTHLGNRASTPPAHRPMVQVQP